MPHLFISYSRTNEAYAHGLGDYLATNGFDIWIDDRIEYGDEWIFVLEQAVADCAAIIVIMTPESRTSRWVRLEIQWAINNDKPIFPLLLAGEVWGVLNPFYAIQVLDGALPNDQFLTRLGRHVSPRQDKQGVNVAPPLDSSNSSVRGLDEVLFSAPPGIDPISLYHTNWFKTETLDPPMIEVEAGPFQMGTQEHQWDDITNFNMLRWTKRTEHIREITLPRYAISKHPITQQQYRRFVEDGGYHIQRYWTREGWDHRGRGTWESPLGWQATADENMEQHPVVGVSWYEAYAYCRWLSTQSEKTYTLPTEAEWEKAARGPEGRIYPWGNHWESARCNTIDSHAAAGESTDHNHQIEQVGSYPHGDSVYGVSDMSGNVLEWCFDVFQLYYDPTCASNLADRSARVVRGGAYYLPRYFARAAFRHRLAPFSRLRYVGFRICEQLKD